MLSESQERMLLVVKKGREAEVEQIFDKWDLHAVHIGEVTSDGRLRVKNHGAGGRRHSESGADRRSPDVSAADGDAGLPRGGAATRPRRARSAAVASRRVQATARLAWHREQAVGLPTVRPHGADQHASAARHGCRRRAREGNVPRTGHVGRLQRPIRVSRPVPRRPARGGGSVAQRRLRRRSADRCHQLPELRQPREARDHVAVRSCGGRHGRSLSRARHSRSRAATSACTTKPMAAVSCRRRSSESSG